jgi:hypothetical protein
MSQISSEADKLQQAMREVRAEIRHDVQELVASAREMADWTSYVRAYPWPFMGAALVLGYLVVPQRARIIRPDVDDLAELAGKDKLVVKVDETARKQGRSIFAGLLETAASSLLQGGVAVLTKQLSQALDSSSRPQPGSSHQGAPQ